MIFLMDVLQVFKKIHYMIYFFIIFLVLNSTYNKIYYVYFLLFFKNGHVYHKSIFKILVCKYQRFIFTYTTNRFIHKSIFANKKYISRFIFLTHINNIVKIWTKIQKSSEKSKERKVSSLQRNIFLRQKQKR